MLPVHGFINFEFDLTMDHNARTDAMHKIRHIPGVQHAGFVHEYSKVKEVCRMGYAYLCANVDCKDVLEKLKSVPGISKAALAAPTTLPVISPASPAPS